jgi:hypothetical protein
VRAELDLGGWTGGGQEEKSKEHFLDRGHSMTDDTEMRKNREQ